VLVAKALFVFVNAVDLLLQERELLSRALRSCVDHKAAVALVSKYASARVVCVGITHHAAQLAIARASIEAAAKTRARDLAAEATRRGRHRWIVCSGHRSLYGSFDAKDFVDLLYGAHRLFVCRLRFPQRLTCF